MSKKNLEQRLKVLMLDLHETVKQHAKNDIHMGCSALINLLAMYAHATPATRQSVIDAYNKECDKCILIDQRKQFLSRGEQ